MRAKFIIAAILAQFVVLGGMAWQRETIIRHGPKVWLSTAPVDPRDIFRGDFVRLDYPISTITRDKFSPALVAELEKRAAASDARHAKKPITVYATLAGSATTGAALAEVDRLDLTPPAQADGLCIKGIANTAYIDKTSPVLTGINYGIDSYFVEQGSGRALERRAPEGTQEGYAVPMEIQVALGADGTAVITGHRWGALGIKVETSDPRAATPTIDVSLCNADSVPHAVVLPKDLRTLGLDEMENPSQVGGIPATPPRGPLPPLNDSDIRLLQPGESTTVTIDLTRLEWFTRDGKGGYIRIGDKTDRRYTSYQVVYRPPPPEEYVGLENAEAIAPGVMRGGFISSYNLE